MKKAQTMAPDWYPPWMKKKQLQSAFEASPGKVATATKKNKELKK